MIVLFDGLLPVKSNFESEARASNLHSIPNVKVLGMHIVLHVCIYIHTYVHMYGCMDGMHVYMSKTLELFMCLL